MIKNLVVSGCSFTQFREEYTSWPQHIVSHYNILNHYNVARGAAGNTYICNSVIDFLEANTLVPEETLVLVMWSGIGRRDARVSADTWFSMTDYSYKTAVPEQGGEFYVFSGGMSNSWVDYYLTKSLFWETYKASDPFVECKESLTNFVNLASYLKSRNYHYRATSFVDYWRSDVESVTAGIYTLGHFAKDMPVYKNFDFEPWFFANQDHRGFYEFAEEHNLIGKDGFHPSAEAHKLYAETVVIPMIDRDFRTKGLI